MARKNLKMFRLAFVSWALLVSLIQVPAVSVGSREEGTTAQALLKVTGMT